MRRIAAVIAIVTAFAALGTASAPAKEIGAVWLAGPGIDGSVRLSDADVASWHNLNVGEPRFGDVPTSDRGPMYLATWKLSVCYGGERPPRVPIEVYPFAEGGALLHVRPQSSRCARGAGMVAGWWRGRPGLLPLLEKYGAHLPVPARPSPAGAPAVDPVASVGRYAGAALVLAVTLAAVALSRRRLTRGSTPA